MKLPFPFFQNKEKQESEYYLALLLTDEKASSIILQESFGELKSIGKHEEFFQTSLEDIGSEQLIALIDKTISRAEEVLPPNIQTHKTVFGVKQDWVESDTKKIKKDYLAKLKKVCDALELTPIGFMVVTEAISHLLQEEEGAPLSAILAEIGRKSVSLTLLRGGKPIEKIDGLIEESAPATVDKLLKHFTTAVLPARIILYDAKEAEKLSQQFIGHQWSKSLPFLHVPQITALPAGFDAKAVTYGAASQMGFELAGLDLKELKEENVEVPAQEEAKETEKREEKAESENPDENTISAENFGFVNGQDITTLVKETTTTTPIHSHDLAEPDFSDKAGFQVNLNQQNFGEDVLTEEEVPTKRASLFGFLSAVRFPKVNLPSMTGNKRFIVPIGIVVALILLIAGLSFYYINNVKANIVLSVSPKMVDEEATILFSGTTSSDFSKNIIEAKALETTVDGSMTIDTTGKKDVGNKAKGTVTIYNNASSPTKLESGTAIKSSNGLTFLLDKDVTVASSSGDVFSGTKPGTADVAVTAKEIGTDSNLPSGTKFTVGSNASLAAKNDSAFSGGSKKQVQVVAKNDIAKLRADLPKSLTDKAREQIAGKAGGEETLLPFISIVTLDKEKFDNEIDDEAKKVTLTASVAFEGLAYENNKINDYAKDLLKSKYSQDISDKSIKIEVKDPEEKKEKEVEAKLAIQAGLLPDINTEDVVKKVESMSLKDAKAFLSGLPQIAKSEIIFSPGIPLLPNLFPRLPKHVSIEITSE